jgi:hypothetical protein
MTHYREAFQRLAETGIIEVAADIKTDVENTIVFRGYHELELVNKSWCF